MTRFNSHSIFAKNHRILPAWLFRTDFEKVMESKAHRQWFAMKTKRQAYCPREKRAVSMEAILTAILDDDRPRATELLKADPGFATRLIDEARLYQSKIYHWIYYGDTALHLAAAGYRVELVQLLLRCGADPNARSNHRQSGPLHYAVDGCITGPYWNAKRQVHTIECLIEAGAEMNARDKNGATPLHRAVRTRCALAVKCLLERGCDATLKNKRGSTPFHLAVQDTGRGGSASEKARIAQREIIKQFLSSGLKPELKDGKGKSVLEWARSTCIKEILSEDSSTTR